MRTLVAFYSFDGNTRLAATAIADEVSADLLEIKPDTDITRLPVIKYLAGGRQAVRNARPKLQPTHMDPEDYDLLFLGTPVRAGHPSPCMSAFLENTTLRGKTVALFCCYGIWIGACFRRLNASLLGNDIIGQVDFRNLLRHKTNRQLEQARIWARKMHERASLR